MEYEEKLKQVDSVFDPGYYRNQVAALAAKEMNRIGNSQICLRREDLVKYNYYDIVRWRKEQIYYSVNENRVRCRNEGEYAFCGDGSLSTSFCMPNSVFKEGFGCPFNDLQISKAE